MKVTIKKIAELSEASIGTVDRVLHNRQGVSLKTKKKVLKIANELGYESNIFGKALVNQRKPMVIGAVILSEQSSYFNAEIKYGIDKAMMEIEKFGIKINYYFMESIDVDEALSIMERVEEDNLSGLIIRPIDDDRIRGSINRLADKGVPVVTCSWDIEDSKRMCFVGHNHYKEGRMAANLLTKLLRGQGKVGILCSTYSVLAQRQKIEGFKEYINEKKVDMEIAQIVETYNEKQITFEKTIELLNSNPDISSLCIQTSYADEVCNAVKSFGIEKELSIFHYGNSTQVYGLLQDNVIDFVIEEDPNLNGYKAVNVLFEKIFYNKDQEEKFIVIDSTIKIEESLNKNSYSDMKELSN